MPTPTNASARRLCKSCCTSGQSHPATPTNSILGEGSNSWAKKACNQSLKGHHQHHRHQHHQQEQEHKQKGTRTSTQTKPLPLDEIANMKLSGNKQKRQNTHTHPHAHTHTHTYTHVHVDTHAHTSHHKIATHSTKRAAPCLWKEALICQEA